MKEIKIYAELTTAEKPYIEITEEELNLIIAKRKKDAHKQLQKKYVEEFNALIKRAETDGFTISQNGSSIRLASPWGDHADKWIRLH